MSQEIFPEKYGFVSSIHLEVVDDVSAEQYLVTLGRFVSRSGTPKEIILDNATQFKLKKQS